MSEVKYLVVLVTGGREYGVAGLNSFGKGAVQAELEARHVWETLGKIHAMQVIDLIVVGGATGADTVAREWAVENEIPHYVRPAKWKKYGNTAGPRRNSAMAAYLAGLPGAKICVAFPGGRGTEDMVDKCARLEQHGVAVEIVRADRDSQNQTSE